MVAITLRWGVVLEDATVGEPGQTVQVSPGFAASLIARGRAALADGGDPAPVAPVESDPVVPMLDGKAAKRSRR